MNVQGMYASTNGFNGYHPHLFERVRKSRGKIEVKCWGGTKLMVPRLYHRVNLLRFISQDVKAWSSGESGKGVVLSPLFVNPQRGRGTLIKEGIELLLSLLPEEKITAIVGVLNDEPIVEQEPFSSLYPDEEMVWGMCQWLTWGRLNGLDVDILTEAEVIEGEKIARTQFVERLLSRVGPAVRLAFIEKEIERGKYPESSEEEIVEIKLWRNIQAFQRVNFKSINCYGCCQYQCGMSINTWYEEDCVDPYINITINKRIPLQMTYSKFKKGCVKEPVTVLKTEVEEPIEKGGLSEYFETEEELVEEDERTILEEEHINEQFHN